MSVMLIAFNGTRESGQFLGDQLVSLKAAYLFVQNHPCARYLLAASPKNDLHFLWQKFIDTYNVQVIYDSFNPGNMDERFNAWNKWRNERQIDGVKFDIYKELYRRVDGGGRQPLLCGKEAGLGRKNVFEYFFYGQEGVTNPCIGGDRFESGLITLPNISSRRGVLIAPYAKCQGNAVFSFAYWDGVIRKLVDAGIPVTVNHEGNFCQDLVGNPLFKRIFPDFKGLLQEVCSHRLVACGNTGVGWLAAAAGVPLLAMQPVDSNMQDYRYEWCGVESLVEFLEEPNVDYCVQRIREEVEQAVVLTTGCFDVLHVGHIRHLEESRSQGTRLVVALNSDDSVRRLKGEGRPVNDQDKRKELLEAFRCVDEVKIFDDGDATKLIHRIRPDVLTNGCDHKLEEIVCKSFVESYGGRVMVTSGERTVTSTKIITKLNSPAADVLKTVKDAVHLSVNPFHKLKLMADQFMSVERLVGDVADVGAYRGACSLIFRRLAPDKNLHLFDTWTGNPHEDPLCHHKRGEWPADLQEVKSVVGTNGKTHYHVGVFPATAKDIKDRQFSFVFVDPDTYPSVKDAIEFFWPRMVKGGKMYFDDWDWEPCSGVRKAVEEKFTAEQRKVFPQEYACVVTKTGE